MLGVESNPKCEQENDNQLFEIRPRPLAPNFEQNEEY